jgi:hypothetical protein
MFLAFLILILWWPAMFGLMGISGWLFLNTSNGDNFIYFSILLCLKSMPGMFGFYGIVESGDVLESIPLIKEMNREMGIY